MNNYHVSCSPNLNTPPLFIIVGEDDILIRDSFEDPDSARLFYFLRGMDFNGKFKEVALLPLSERKQALEPAWVPSFLLKPHDINVVKCPLHWQRPRDKTGKANRHAPIVLVSSSGESETPISPGTTLSLATPTPVAIETKSDDVENFTSSPITPKPKKKKKLLKTSAKTLAQQKPKPSQVIRMMLKPKMINVNISPSPSDDENVDTLPATEPSLALPTSAVVSTQVHSEPPAATSFSLVQQITPTPEHSSTPEHVPEEVKAADQGLDFSPISPSDQYEISAPQSGLMEVEQTLLETITLPNLPQVPHVYSEVLSVFPFTTGCRFSAFSYSTNYIPPTLLTFLMEAYNLDIILFRGYLAVKEFTDFHTHTVNRKYALGMAVRKSLLSIPIEINSWNTEMLGVAILFKHGFVRFIFIMAPDTSQESFPLRTDDSDTVYIGIFPSLARTSHPIPVLQYNITPPVKEMWRVTYSGSAHLHVAPPPFGFGSLTIIQAFEATRFSLTIPAHAYLVLETGFPDINQFIDHLKIFLNSEEFSNLNTQDRYSRIIALWNENLLQYPPCVIFLHHNYHSLIPCTLKL